MSAMELSIGITCICLPTFKPFFHRRFFRNRDDSYYYDNSAYAGGTGGGTEMDNTTTDRPYSQPLDVATEKDVGNGYGGRWLENRQVEPGPKSPRRATPGEGWRKLTGEGAGAGRDWDRQKQFVVHETSSPTSDV